MYQMRNGYYYLYNSKTGKEKVAYVDNNCFAYINVLSEDDEFGLGTYLCGFMEVSTFICDIKNKALSYGQTANIVKARYDYLPTNDSVYVNNLVHCIYFCLKDSEKNNNLKDEISNIKYICDYVYMCEDEKTLCKSNVLLKYVGMKSIILKQGEILVSNINNIGENAGDIVGFLKEKAKIEPDIHIYKIDTLTDLILSSLQAIFMRNRTIKQCENCYRTFVPLKRNDEKYCNYNIIGEIGVCSKKAYITHRKTYFSNKEIRHLYDNIRSKLNNRVQYIDKNRIDEEQSKLQAEYDDFLKDYNEYVNSIKNCKLTEEDLYRWLIEKDKTTRRQ